MTRYHPVLVALHWLLAALILIALIMGSTVLANIPNDDPEKLTALSGHMAIGIVILGLMLIRIVVRLVTKAPPHPEGSSAVEQKAGAAVHGVLYLLVLAMAASGIGMSLLAGLPDIVFGGSGAPLPESFTIYTPRQVHGLVSKLLMALIALHVAAALWHRFAKKDRVMARMWFGRRDA